MCLHPAENNATSAEGDEMVEVNGLLPCNDWPAGVLPMNVPSSSAELLSAGVCALLHFLNAYFCCDFIIFAQA